MKWALGRPSKPGSSCTVSISPGARIACSCSRVAAAGIEEFVIEFLPGLLSQDGIEALGGTLHLHATDGATEWWIDLDDGSVTVQANEVLTVNFCSTNVTNADLAAKIAAGRTKSQMTALFDNFYAQP